MFKVLQKQTNLNMWLLVQPTSHSFHYLCVARSRENSPFVMSSVYTSLLSTRVSIRSKGLLSIFRPDFLRHFNFPMDMVILTISRNFSRSHITPSTGFIGGVFVLFAGNFYNFCLRRIFKFGYLNRWRYACFLLKILTLLNFLSRIFIHFILFLARSRNARVTWMILPRCYLKMSTDNC